MTDELFTKIKSRIWHSGGGMLTDKELEIISNIIVEECASYITAIYNGNFHVIADELEEYFRREK